MQDDRVNSVELLRIERGKKCVSVEFLVKSVFGDIAVEKVVNY